MWRLVPTLVREMGQAYPELIRAEALITETLRLEETRFRKTLERGLAILDEETASSTSGDRLKGETAFTLYDTYGFPLDLTQDALQPRGIARRYRWLQGCHGAAAAKARAAWAGSGDAATEAVWFALREQARRNRIPRLRDRARRRRCRGARSRRQAKSTGLTPGESGMVILNQTPFYGESGGQVGDTGGMSADGIALRVTDTQKKAGDLFVHCVTVDKGALEVGDRARRSTSTTSAAPPFGRSFGNPSPARGLRQVLGDHVAQKGSLVAPDRLRFDFAHPKPMTKSEIERVEDIANDVVLQNSPVTTRLMARRRRASHPARAHCSARNTATRYGLWPWGRAAATPWAGRSSSAAARMCAARATSA